MPLKHGKSKEAFSHNVEAEMHAGKPMKQALAIAYSVKRRNKKAHGGMIGMADRAQEVLPREEQEHDHMIPHAAEPKRHVMPDEENKPPQMLAKGGVVDHDEPMEGDIDNFLSDEEEDRSVWRGKHSSSDEEELDRSGFNPPSRMDNQKNDEEEMQSRRGILSDIMRKVRMRNMGTR